MDQRRKPDGAFAASRRPAGECRFWRPETGKRRMELGRYDGFNPGIDKQPTRVAK